MNTLDKEKQQKGKFEKMGKQKGPRLTKEELAERKRTKKLLAKEKKEEQVRQVKRVTN